MRVWSFAQSLSAVVASAVAGSLLVAAPVVADDDVPPWSAPVDTAVDSAPALASSATPHGWTPKHVSESRRRRVRIPKHVSKTVHVNSHLKSVDSVLKMSSPVASQVVVNQLGATGSGKIEGSLFAVSVHRQGANAAGPLHVSMKTSEIAGAFGGSYDERLRVVEFGSCALHTSTGEHCAGRTLNSTRSGEWLNATASVTDDVVVFALLAGASSEQGTFSATKLPASGTWNAGGSTGSFTYQYPIPTPPSVSGAAPDVTLTYDSQDVDARTSKTNGQASWIGQGWSYDPGWVEQVYRPCGETHKSTSDKLYGYGDLCWSSSYSDKSLPSAVVHFHGRTMDIIRTSSGWSLANGDGSTIERLSGASNGTHDKHYWRLTDTKGTQYDFGIGQLVSKVTTKTKMSKNARVRTLSATATGSVATVPVIGDDAGEPCHNSDLTKAVCTQGYQFHLDRVVDSNGNLSEYTYGKETNEYRPEYVKHPSTYRSYTAAIYPASILYGLNTHTNTTHVQAEVRFEASYRCRGTIEVSDPMKDVVGCKSILGQHKDEYPDVPADLHCVKNVWCTNISPTFYEQSRLNRIITYVRNAWDGRLLRPVREYQLTSKLPSATAATSHAMWLDGIQGRGFNFLTSDRGYQTVFGAVTLKNRHDGDASKALHYQRINAITTDTGGKIAVTYSQPHGCAIKHNSSAATFAANHGDCFPSYFQSKPGATPTWGVFNKWLATTVAQHDLDGLGGSTITHHYAYSTPAWSWTNSPITVSHQTWDQWRGSQTVTDTSGTNPTVVTQTHYFRGLNGTRDGAGHRVEATVTDPILGQFPDGGSLAGQVLYSQTGPSASSPLTLQHTSYHTIDHGASQNTAQQFPVGRATIIVPATSVAETRGHSGTRYTRTRTSYESHGLPTSVVDDGDWAPAGNQVVGDETCTVTGYQHPSSHNMIAFPVQTSVYPNTSCNGTPIRANTIRYDGHSDTSTALVRGNPTFTSQWVTAGGGHPVETHTSYDDWGRVHTQTDAAGVVTTMTYKRFDNGGGHFADMWWPAEIDASATSPTGTGSHWNTRTSIDEDNGEQRFTIDVNGRGTWYPRDSWGHTTGVDKWFGGHDQRVRYVYPAAPTGPTTVKTPLHVTTETLGTGVTDPGATNRHWVVSMTWYDGFGRARRTQTQTPAKSTTHHLESGTDYDDNGFVSHQFSSAPASGAVTTVHNASWSTVQGAHSFTYDALGRTLSDTTYGTKAGGTAGHLEALWHTSTAYDGYTTTVTNPESGVSTSTSDAHGNVLSTVDHDTDRTVTTTNTYDRLGNLTGLTQGTGRHWSYSYDQLGRRITADDPDTGHTSYTYNTLGKVTSVTTASHVTTTAYDHYGRSTVTKVDGQQTSATTYDPTNNLGAEHTQTTTTAGGNFVHSNDGFDGWGRVTHTSWTIPVTSRTPATVAGTYRESVTLDLNGTVLTSTAGAVGGLPEQTTHYGHLDNGSATTLSVSQNGSSVPVVTGTQYSEDYGWLTSRSWAGDASDALSRQMSYDQVRREPAVNTYKYGSTLVRSDQLHFDRLSRPVMEDTTSAWHGGQRQCFSYSLQTNVLVHAWTQTISGSSCMVLSPTSAGWVVGEGAYNSVFTADAQTDRLARRVDGNASDTSAAVTSVFHYDSHHPDQVSSVVRGGDSTSYTYTATGLRTSASGGGSDRVVSWDSSSVPDTIVTGTGAGAGTDELVYASDGSRLVDHDPVSGKTVLTIGSTQVTARGASVSAKRLFSMGGQIVATTDSYLQSGHQWRQIGVDLQNSMTVQSDPTPTGLVATGIYSPYGTQRNSDRNWDSSRGFLSKQATPAGLVQTDHRLYDPATTDFWSPDPLLDTSSPNPYSYAQLNPVSQADPSGLQAITYNPDFFTNDINRSQFYHQMGIPDPYAGGYTFTDNPGHPAVPIAQAHFTSRPLQYGTGMFTINPTAMFWGGTAGAVEGLAYVLTAIDVIQLGADPFTDGLTAITYGMRSRALAMADRAIARATARTATRKAVAEVGEGASSAQIVQAVARSQAARGPRALLRTLSRQSRDAVTDRPRMQSMFVGRAVHEQTAKALNKAFPDRFTYSTRGPDFYDNHTGGFVELTTPGQVGRHISRGGDYVDADYATYEVPR